MTDIAVDDGYTAVVIASGDYKSSDPTSVVVAVGNSNGGSLRVSVVPTAQTGAGNTVTLTAVNADTGFDIDTLEITAGAEGAVSLSLTAAVKRVRLSPVGSGTRTTLTYSVRAAWHPATGRSSEQVRAETGADAGGWPSYAEKGTQGAMAAGREPNTNVAP